MTYIKHDKRYIQPTIIVSVLAQENEERDRGRIFERMRLFQILAERRGAYSKEALRGGRRLFEDLR